MPRRPSAPEAPDQPRRWRYIDDAERVLTTVVTAAGHTLLAVPGHIYADLSSVDGHLLEEHPLLEATDEPATPPPAPPVEDAAPESDTAPTPAAVDSPPAGEQTTKES